MATMAGAAISGDLKTLKRGWYQYSAFASTFQKSFKHMALVFKKASVDPTSVGYIMRDDIALKNEQTMNVLQAFAQSAEADGDLGPMALYNMAESLHDISQNPILRFGTNAMTAMDGFTRAFIAVGEARGKVYDKYINAAGDLKGKTLAAADNGTIIVCSSNSAVTITVPASLPTGFNCMIIQSGSGQVSLSASSTTLNNRNGTKTAGQHAIMTIVHLGSNAFVVSGDTSSS